MKNMKNILKTTGLVVCMGLTMNSCDLDLLPLNEVVLENYWTNKEDVENVLNSCYLGMQQNGWVSKAIIWGEVRSDNITYRQGSSSATPVYLQNVIKGNLKQTNSACEWSAFYTVINRCNTVIYYAPKVEDPNITPTLLKQILAEAKAIRALNYFYLVRTFNKVPFSFTPSIDDTQTYRVKATAGEDIIDSLIVDLEACKNDARKKYGAFSYDKNSGRITRNAIYSILADMYLWRASDANLPSSKQQELYKKCVECCDYVLNAKIAEYRADEDGLRLNSTCDKEVMDRYGYPLLQESSSESATTTNVANAYTRIFGTGNSFESIFELTYGHEQEDIKNTDVGGMYGYYPQNSNTVSAALGASTTLMNSKPTGMIYNDNSLFSTGTDYRTVTGLFYDESSTSYYEILKYASSTISGFKLDGTTWAPANSQNASGSRATASRRSYNSSYEGWIIYRMTDLMLMRAEAEIELGNLLAQAVVVEPEDTTSTEEPSEASPRKVSALNGSSLATAEEYYDDAFNLIAAVYLRSNPIAKSSPNAMPQRASYSNYGSLINLLYLERQREFLFEGKRYFDLVRAARRKGDTSDFVKAIIAKFTDGNDALKAKMTMMDFMYMPYAEAELDANPELVQNPVYISEETYVIK